MFKRMSLILLTITLWGTACSSQLMGGEAEFAPGAAPEPMEAMAEEVVELGSRAADSVSNLPQATERIVIKDANLSIVVDEPGESMDQIAQMADEMGGFVVSSNLYQTTLESGVEVPRASIVIRVPADRLNEALNLIEANATQVLSRNESGEDVTQDYTDLQSRLRNLEDAEVQLREIMASASKTEDVINVFNQLTSIREQIEVIKGRIQFYEQSAAFSAISVDLLANEAVQPLTIGGWQPVGVAKDAIQALINTLKFLASAAIWIALWVLPTALILLIPLGLIWRGIRRWRRRRAEAAPPPSE